jgi:hypothetical protein
MMQQQHVTMLRRGQFLWMEPAAQHRYLQNLRQRIAEGYYNTDRVFAKVAEDISPVLEDIIAGE